MSIGRIEKPLIVSMIPDQTPGERAAVQPSVQTENRFAGKLDAALSTEAAAHTSATASSAQTLAEALKLQMLHTTLALAGDQTQNASSPLPFNQQSGAIQSLLNAYRANQVESNGSAGQPAIPAQPLPDAPDSPASTTFSPAIPTGSQWLEPIIARASSRYGVDASLIKAVIKAESNFNPRAVSSAGARGLMQLMPGTARGLGVTDSFDPEQNVMAGTRFLRNLLDRYDGNLDAALAAYNWGPGNVDKHPTRLPSETRAYLARIKQLLATDTA